ncbi:MAG: DUF3179 domain-containing (seleno)protein [Cyclobacteriaceae bacterium]
MIFLTAVLLLNSQCSKREATGTSESELHKPQRPLAYTNGKIFNSDGKTFLFGGEDSTQHFNIDNIDLNVEQLHYGIGREAFPALLEPEFVSVPEADSIWPDTSRFLVAWGEGQVKAYSIKDLTRHEVVNDRIDGRPVMAAYCILADLGAIYERQYGKEELTFALSGYTYYDDEVWNGLDGFVFWDRETESLWWPLIGRAVSGKLKGVKLMETDTSQWMDTQWSVVKERFPNALVLKSGQDFMRPTEWREINDVDDIVKNYK